MKTTLKEDLFLSKVIGRDFFNINILRQNIRFQKNAVYSYCFDFNLELINLCHKLDFRYISSRVVLKRNKNNQLKHFKFPKEYILDKEVTKEDWNNIYNVSSIIAKNSRFNKDLRIRKYAKKIYKQWILNSILSGYADDYVFIRYKKLIIAFLTIKRNNASYSIDLIGVDAKFQNKGIGSLLISYMIEKYRTSNFYTGTQAENIIALNFYLKNQFKIHSYQVIFHKYT
ncbi:GNAT family N-acetyltransferase [Candidatus Gottesmanbacteria bacterium]|nr:GNAT family N-acetyltransferase [Candidatus Gottesmanbacteria bacterium]